jgi:hypothetical protein
MGWTSTPHKETALAKSPSSSENIHFVAGLDGAVIASIQRSCAVYHYQNFNQATVNKYASLAKVELRPRVRSTTGINLAFLRWVGRG